MSEALFPSYICPWFGASKRQEWNAQVRRSASGRRRALTFYETPIWVFSLPFGALARWEIELLMGFFAKLKGEYDTFYFLDPMNRVEDLEIGPGDGGVTSFRLFRDWFDGDLYREYPQFPAGYPGGYGFGGYLTPEVYGYGVPIQQEPYIYLDGVLQTTGYSIDADGWVTFDTAPGSSVSVTATYYFCYKAAFRESPDWETLFVNYWKTTVTIESVKT